MQLTLNSQAILEGLTSDAIAGIKKALTLPNPKYIQIQKMGRYLGKTSPVLRYYRQYGSKLIFPRGFAEQAAAIATHHPDGLKLISEQINDISATFAFKGELHQIQQNAVNDVIKFHDGVLVAGTGAGKTVMALWLIAARAQKTLVIVHTKELLHQWIDRIEQFLGIPAKEVGQIGGGKFRLGDKITVSMVQTLCKRVGDIQGQFGQVVVDECHRTPSTTFTNALKALSPKHLLGLTATNYRRDGMGAVIEFYMGPTRHTVSKSALLARNHLCEAQVEFHHTDFITTLDASQYYSKVMTELAEDSVRNRQICWDVATKSSHGITLILSDRKAHCLELQRVLKKIHGIEAGLLIGSMGKKARDKVSQGIEDGTIKTLICTGQLVGEGYDLPALETLFLAMPIKFSGRLIQYIGRILRPAPGKKYATIHDYVDAHLGVLLCSARARSTTYANERIWIKNPLMEHKTEGLIDDCDYL